MNNCQHLNRIGDNYGESCSDCGKQLSGYGWGGWFGRNLTEDRHCIHLFAPLGEKGSAEWCIYCQLPKTIGIKPKKDCKACHGTGIVSDSVPWGSTTASLDSYCDCVLEQVEDDAQEIELVAENCDG